MGTADGRGYVIPPRYWMWVAHPVVLRVGMWVVALTIGVHHFNLGRRWKADAADAPPELRRAEPGGHGYTQIDFGGQWVMGRMLVLGHGRELYDRRRQWEVVRAGYPVSAESPAQREETILPGHLRVWAKSDDDVGHDADRLMSWFMGEDPPEWKTVGGAVAAAFAADNPLAAAAFQLAAPPAVFAEVQKPTVGGPLYPPVHAFVYAPLGLYDRPGDAYRVFQAVAVGFAYLAGLGLCLLTGRRVWWSVASAGVLLFPGCGVGIELGQNPTLTLAVAVWGWVLAARGRDAAGGAVWGLFAFKPVWGLAFFLVPVVMRRWRFAAAMVGTGAALGLATLPVVGVQAWFDWLAVGKEAAMWYTRSANWINLSRDLQGIPRRLLHDFTRSAAEDDPRAPAVAWALWGVVFAATVLVYVFRADRRRPVGVGAAFLFLGAFLTCYRFMYYDVLVAVVGVACLFADPARLFRTRVFGVPAAAAHPPALDRAAAVPAAPAAPFGPRLVGYVNSFPLTVIFGLYLVANAFAVFAAEATLGVLSWGSSATAADGSTAFSSPRLRLDTGIHYPWDTALVIALWAWCGVRLLRGDERPASVLRIARIVTSEDQGITSSHTGTDPLTPPAAG